MKTKILAFLLISVPVFGVPVKRVAPKHSSFRTTNVCRVVNNTYIFTGHDGKQGKSAVSCTAAFVEWVYTK